MSCDFSQTFDEALEKSSAIFLGEVIETKRNVFETRHGKGEDWHFKFKVLKSWKLVDKNYVWLESFSNNLKCTRIEEGKSYLVFANEKGNTLFIHPDSRTDFFDTIESKESIQKLGETTLTIKDGEFTDHRNTIYGCSILILIVLIAFAILYAKRIKTRFREN